MRGTISEHPDVGVHSLLEHRFERQRQRATRLVAAPRIADSGVGNHLSYGAFAARHIPYRARQLVHKHLLARSFGILARYICLQSSVFLIYLGKERVGLLLLSEQHSVEAHPLGAAQRRSLHVVGSLDYGYVQFAHATITAAVLERREEDGIGRKVDNRLYGRAQRTAAVANLACLYALFHPRKVNIHQVAHATNGIGGTQFIGQGTMNAGCDERFLQWCVYYRCSWMQRLQAVVTCTAAVAGHQQIGMQRLPEVPGVGKSNHTVAVAIDNFDAFGILHLQGVAHGIVHFDTAATRSHCRHNDNGDGQ